MRIAPGGHFYGGVTFRYLATKFAIPDGNAIRARWASVSSQAKRRKWNWNMKPSSIRAVKNAGTKIMIH